jgi:hypothetical protein
MSNKLHHKIKYTISLDNLNKNLWAKVRECNVSEDAGPITRGIDATKS